MVATIKGSGEAFVLVNTNFVQYEWVEDENKWMKFFPSDPEPPTDLPPGKFDGQVIDVEK